MSVWWPSCHVRPAGVSKAGKKVSWARQAVVNQTRARHFSLEGLRLGVLGLKRVGLELLGLDFETLQTHRAPGSALN